MTGLSLGVCYVLARLKYFVGWGIGVYERMWG